MRLIILVFLFFSHSFALWADDFGRYRKWSTITDETLNAAYLGTQGELGAFFLRGEPNISLMPLELLSNSDKAYLNANGWPISDFRATNWKRDLSISSWQKHYRPSTILNTYESEHFRVHSEDGFMQATWEQIFEQLEAFYHFMQYSPWGIAATPAKDKFNISIAKDKKSYYQAGGLAGSQGVYLSEHQLIITYAGAMGIRGGKRASNVSINVLSHELTHQLMHDYINIVPPWLAEGVAKYFEMFPIVDGFVNASAFDEKVKEYHRGQWGQGKGDAVNGMAAGFQAIFRMSYEKWQRGGVNSGQIDLGQNKVRWQYHKAFLLVYYLLESPRAEYGGRLMRYLEARKYQVKRRDDYNVLVKLYNAEIEKYNQSLLDFAEHPSVRVSKNPSTGVLRYHYPEGLNMPQPPRYEKPKLVSHIDMFNHLGLLHHPDQSEDEFFVEVEEFLQSNGF